MALANAAAAHISFIKSGGSIKGTIPIATLPDEYLNRISSKTNIILLSSDTLQKNAVRHPEITTQDYLNLQAIVDNAQVVVQDGPNTLVFINTSDKTCHAAIKATQTGKGLFMTSLRRTRESYIERIKNTGEVIKN